MEINEMKNIWIEIEGVLTPKSKDELKEILLSKTKRILNKFKLMLIGSISICTGVIAFLIIASIDLKNDVLYLINNSVLSIILIIYLRYYLRSYKKLYLQKSDNYNVYGSLKNKVLYLSRELKSKFEIVLLPLLAILLLQSFNVFYTTRSFMGIYKDTENLWGLLFGLLLGVLVAYIFGKKVSKYQTKKLGILKNYLKELESI